MERKVLADKKCLPFSGRLNIKIFRFKMRSISCINSSLEEIWNLILEKLNLIPLLFHSNFEDNMTQG